MGLSVVSPSRIYVPLCMLDDLVKIGSDEVARLVHYVMAETIGMMWRSDWTSSTFCTGITALKMRDTIGSHTALPALDKAVVKGLIFRCPTYVPNVFPKGIRFDDRWFKSLYRVEEGETRFGPVVRWEWIKPQRHKPKNPKSKRANKQRVEDHAKLGATRANMKAKLLNRLTTSDGWYSRHTEHDKVIASGISRGIYFAIRDDYGRFHTSFSSLSSHARLDTIDKETGSRLASVDMTSCHPLLAWVAAAIDHGCPNWKFTDQLRDDGPVGNLPLQWIGSKRYMGFESEYRKLCESGELYETLLMWCRDNGVKWADLQPPKAQEAELETKQESAPSRNYRMGEVPENAVQ